MHEDIIPLPRQSIHHHPTSYDINHSQAAPGTAGRIAATTTTQVQKARTPTATPQMKLTIPSDQELGHRIESIVRTIAAVIAFVYAAGFTFGQALHWLSANLTQLHTYLLKPADEHSRPRPVVVTADASNRSDTASPHRARARGFAT